MREGWKCPVCGAGVAPTEKRCEHGGGLSGSFVPTSYPPVVTIGGSALQLVPDSRPQIADGRCASA